MSTALLRDTFQNLLGPAKQMQAQYLPQIQQKASTLDASDSRVPVEELRLSARRVRLEVRADE